MAGELGLILQLILGLLPLLTEDEMEKITKEIEKLRKQHADIRERLKQALAEGDIPAINFLLSSLLGEL
ncbi:MAG: hypothetical protein A2Y86_05170 [Candidatus Aminicenantes bacterium RBG_13_62_12]|nr:MAG: hypothetical protein A2Y86_05170 [Candidatus Aminicenantes bacterium RBG_13_62_12]